jgi:hypothetical protein
MAPGRVGFTSGLRQNLNLIRAALINERALRRTPGPRRRGTVGPAQDYRECRGCAECVPHQVLYATARVRMRARAWCASACVHSIYKDIQVHGIAYAYIRVYTYTGTKCFEKLCIAEGFEPMISCILSPRLTTMLQA